MQRGPVFSGPLSGVRVIDLTAVLMGPTSTQMLADLGADVIKVEAPDGDAVRKVGPGGDVTMGPIFLGANRNKRSLILDLKKAEGREALLRLAETVDVLVCNIRPKAMKRLKLEFADLSERNPRLIYVSLIGFSQQGRYASLPAFDDLIQAGSGVPWAMAASSDGAPRYVPVNIADRSVGIYAFGVICAALYSREQTGRGQQVDVPMFETVIPMVLGDHLYGHKFSPAKGPFGYPRILAKSRRPFATKDGYLCCTIYHDEHWVAFLDLIGKQDLWTTDSRLSNITVRTVHSEELGAFIEAELKSRTTAYWQETMSAVGIPNFPVHNFETLMADPHLADIGYFQEVEHPAVGTIRELRVPSEWHGTRLPKLRPAPQLGEHSREVLAEIGYRPEEVDELVAHGVTSCTKPISVVR